MPVGKLTYMMNVSLDGFVETPDHRLDWTAVDEELHGWFNEQSRRVDASLYGRRLYEVMAAHWPTAKDDPTVTGVEREFAEIWNAKPIVVFSTSLESVVDNARLVRGDVGTVLAEVRKEFPGDLEVGGPNLASQFIQRGLVDEFNLVIHPVAIGAGTPFWPALDAPLRLRQTGTRTFESGVVSVSFERA